MDFLGMPSAARASFAVYSHRKDIDSLVESLATVRKIFA
jgi:selenocysteine lyase/cysteine desulfurase